jgi:putative glutamine amidotransferase
MRRPLIGLTCTRLSSLPARQVAETTQAYVHAVESSGGLPLLIPFPLQPEAIQVAFDRVDGLLLTGGEDIAPERYGMQPGQGASSPDPERDAVELALASMAAQHGKPVLGICRGFQAINVALGGTLVRDLPTERPGEVEHNQPDLPFGATAHDVHLSGDGLLQKLGLQGEMAVNSSHHQGILDLAPGVSAIGRAPDGLIEAMELPGHPFFIGVQWHPERLLERPESRALFLGLIRSSTH